VKQAGRDCAFATAPASTFKIPHAIIALETKAIRSDEILDYDRTSLSFETWKGKHDLPGAIRWSVYPFFRVTAARIGRKPMMAGLERLRYAKDRFEGDHTEFWTNGDLVVTPREQLDFLRRIFSGQLVTDAGASDGELRSAVNVVKEALVMPQGSITNAAGTHPFPLRWGAQTVVRAKTGNTRVGEDRISWLVGEIEQGSRKWVFASRVRAQGSLKSTAGAELALRELNLEIKIRR